MPNTTQETIYFKVEEIIADYLQQIYKNKNHNHFQTKWLLDPRAKLFSSYGFDILGTKNTNHDIVAEEAFLEGSTRVFLINPILELLLNSHGIQNDWKNGQTFGNFTISNREYELGNFLEFIAVLDNKHIGVRYTPYMFTNTEVSAMFFDSTYFRKNKPIPGFSKLPTIDEIYVLNWSCTSEDAIIKQNQDITAFTTISVKSFFERFFPLVVFQDIYNKLCIAIDKAKKMIALQAVPQLLPNNILNFKKALLEMFSVEYVDSLSYINKNGNLLQIICPEDIAIIKNSFFKNNYRSAIIGQSDFAKSFITAEYLFKSINAGLSIDYTAIVVGYIKSVEQLLYLFYLSAFQGKNSILYWDNYRNHPSKEEKFDLNSPDKYRFDPYSKQKKRMQEKYNHDINQKNVRSPDLGNLIFFLRYYTDLWAISETSKEVVWSCLNDFRESCRNSHFHKDNIEFSQYSTVTRIRNNTHVCLYYLLGGFILLDPSKTAYEQLGILNFRLEELYFSSMWKRKGYLFPSNNKIENVFYCLSNEIYPNFNEDGTLPDIELHFLNTGLTKENASQTKIDHLLSDEMFVKENTVIINRKNMPSHFSSFILKKI